MRSKIGLLVVSDTRTLETDESGPAAQAALRKLGYQDVERRICPDVVKSIQTNLVEMCDLCGAVFTIGGTGFSHRDVTPEATLPLLQRRADSIVELLRAKGLERTPFSHLSRGVAGTRGNALIVNLPGSPGAAADGIAAMADLLAPILQALSGEACPVPPSMAQGL